MIEYLTLEDVLERITVMDAAVRDVGLIEAAVARPRTSIFGRDAYAELPQKAAALMQSLVMNHALEDGNKRLGLSCALAMLRLNGCVSAATKDELFELIIERGLDVDAIAQCLRAAPQEPSEGRDPVRPRHCSPKTPRS